MFALPPAADLDSTAGSEWDLSDFEGGRPGSSAASATHLTSVSKEQLFQMLQKARARYHKYKGRAADVVKAYQDLEAENAKIKNVMQQTQVLNTVHVTPFYKAHKLLSECFYCTAGETGLCSDTLKMCLLFMRVIEMFINHHYLY